MGFATLQTLIARFMNCQPSPMNVSQCQHPVAGLTPDLRSRLQRSLATDAVLLTAFDQVSNFKNLTNLYTASDATPTTTTKGTRLNGSNSIKALTLANVPKSSWDILLAPLQIPPQPYFGTPAGFLPFPMSEYISAPFYTAIASYFPLGLVLSYLYALSKVLVVLVLEKESRSRELMKILGVHESSIVLSWYCTYILLFLAASIFQGIASATLLFPHSNLLLLILFYFVFGLSVLAFAFCISALFSRARTASYAGMIVFFLMYFMSQSFSTLATEGQYTGTLDVFYLSGCVF
jgi:ATP-binding cassette subfamily A (ABC1) protein 1